MSDLGLGALSRDRLIARIEALEAAGEQMAQAVGAFALAYEPMLVNWNSSDFVIASCGNVKITVGHLGAAAAALAAWRKAEKGDRDA